MIVAPVDHERHDDLSLGVGQVEVELSLGANGVGDPVAVRAPGGSRAVVAGERYAALIPAILVPRGNPKKIKTLLDLTRNDVRVGIADPGSVCVGLYAVEILLANGIEKQVRPNLRGMVESCAKTAAMLPLGTVDAVLGWREFAAWNPQGIEAIPLKQKEIPRLAYIPAGRLRHAMNPENAKAFIAYLKSEEGQAIFHKWGYFTKEENARKLVPEARIASPA